jgi:hypothetical protein
MSFAGKGSLQPIKQITMNKLFCAVLILLGCCFETVAQNSNPTTLSQKVKGTVIDADSKKPLQSATVALFGTNKKALTDSSGNFVLNDVPVGRQSLEISMVGYENKQVPEIVIGSGKEVFLTIALVEKISTLSNVTVVGGKARTKASNEFATASARSFSMEDAKRYPAAAFDPGRMAQNFAGVSNNGDGSNEIVVRGNSPKGVLWRLEGVEIPNPNHFSGLGGTGGAISMISSNTMGNSDFYTGAFPAEFGNATAGVFDINFRNGNKDKREYTFLAGILGLEAAAEGPFKKGGKASYLINARYSTLQLLGKIVDLGGSVAPDYRDISFKLNFPYKNGNSFSLFGIGGANKATNVPPKDSTKWTGDVDNIAFDAPNYYSVAGLSNQSFITKNSYIKTILSFNYTLNKSTSDTLNPSKNYAAVPVGKEYNKDVAYRASILYNNKLNSQHTLRIGFIASQLQFNYLNSYYDDRDKKFKDLLKAKGSSNYLQAYAQWKYRLNNNLTLQTGLHASYLALNKTKSIEPRASITYKVPNNQTFTFAAGLHARPEALSTYFYEFVNQNSARSTPNKNLEMQKAMHYVLSYEKVFRSSVRFKTELYYQYLFDVPVEKKNFSYFSILNSSSFYELDETVGLVNTGTGKNYGIDISIEKPFAKQYYFIATASLYQSKFTNYDNKEFNTKFNRNYQVNLIGGREWTYGKKRNSTFGCSIKLLTSGGLKESPIDVPASRVLGKTRYIQDQYFTQSTSPYFRSDISFSFKKNRKHSTHSINLDFQNFTNRQNVYNSYFDTNEGVVKKSTQLGLLPIINYRIEF